MNVKELLISCNIEQVSALHFAIQESPKCDDPEIFLQAHRDFIQEVKHITPEPSNFVILGCGISIDGQYYPCLNMYDKAEIRQRFRRCPVWEENRLPEHYTDMELKSLSPVTLQYFFPCSYDMELMFWNDILGAEIFEANAEALGPELLAALLIQEMTFFGFQYETSRQEQSSILSQVEDAMKEIDGRECAPDAESFPSPDNFAVRETASDVKVQSWDSAVLLREVTHENWIQLSISQYRELLRYAASVNNNDTPMLLVCAGVEGAGKTSISGILQEHYPNILETTLCPEDIAHIRRARQEGYYIRLIYLGLDTLEDHLSRVQSRVSKGGAFADPAEVAHQLQNRFANLEAVLPLCHEVSLCDCTYGFRQVAQYRYGTLRVTEDGSSCPWLQEWLENTTLQDISYPRKHYH